MKNIQKSVENSVASRMSGKHCTSMHNAIARLSLIPATHINGRKAVEESIFHLHSVHRVVITEKLKNMLKAANPSDELMLKLFPADIVEKSKIRIWNFATVRVASLQ